MSPACWSCLEGSSCAAPALGRQGALAFRAALADACREDQTHSSASASRVATRPGTSGGGAAAAGAEALADARLTRGAGRTNRAVAVNNLALLAIRARRALHSLGPRMAAGAVDAEIAPTAPWPPLRTRRPQRPQPSIWRGSVSVTEGGQILLSLERVSRHEGFGFTGHGLRNDPLALCRGEKTAGRKATEAAKAKKAGRGSRRSARGAGQCTRTMRSLQS